MFTYLLSLFVIPHGITDIIVSYETNTYYEMSLMYLLAPFTFILMNKSLYKLSFLGLSILHFSHSIYPCIPYFIMGLYFLGQLNYNEGMNYITLYLSFIHTPEHYYEILWSTNYIYEHLSIIFCMTMISIVISPHLINWIEIHSGEDRLSKYVGGIIMSHILFNEYLLLPLCKNT